MHDPSPAAARAANRRGILAMAAAMACFVTNDAMVKYASQSLPAAQLIFVRGLFSSALLLAAVFAMGAGRQLGALRNGKVTLRAAFDAFATVTYLGSLFHLPIGTATAINMATPLVITAVAVLALGERVDLGRWLAIATGFLGVLLIVQPAGDSFNAWALLCLLGTLLHAGRDLLTRAIDRSIPSIVITFSTSLAVTLLTGFASLFLPWATMEAWHFGLLAGASVFLSAGYFLLIIAMRSGEMSLVAPFRYVGLLYALGLGFVVWGDVPNALAWAGSGLLVAAGWYVTVARPSRKA